MPRPTKTTIVSFRHAFDGIVHMVRTEQRIRVYLALAAGIIGIGAWMRLTREGWFFLFFALTLVLLAEMMHTAICACVALFVDRHHPAATRACDMARAAALFAAIVAAATILAILIYQPV
jgi:diacylglycerol kinase